jgi:hypothetical protein
MRKAANKPYDKPNLVMNAAVQVCCTSFLFCDVTVKILISLITTGEKAARCM